MASSSKPDQASKFNSPLLPEADEEVSPPSDADVGVLSLPWVVDALSSPHAARLNTMVDAKSKAKIFFFIMLSSYLFFAMLLF